MDPTLRALTELLLRAVPTILFLTLLTIYLKFVFFKPIERVLLKRHEQTEGVRHLAEKAFKEADRKAAQFEQALIAAKMELYREQEAQRRRLLEEQTKALADARRVAETRIEETRLELAVESERAIAEMAAQIRELSKEMIAGLFGRRAA
jgi:F0F1-type ATP synthase membrane subunit b/b'